MTSEAHVYLPFPTPSFPSLATSTCTLTQSFKTRWGHPGSVCFPFYSRSGTGLLATLALRSLGGGCVEGVWEEKVRM